MKFNQKGFTIIELIVVIAIIAVLAAIVLVNVTQYINKGKNAAIKGNLSTVMTNAAVYFEANSSKFGSDFVGTSNYTIPEAAIASAQGTKTVSVHGDTATQAWCACAMLVPVGDSGTVFCVDSTGAKEETASTTCTAQCTTAYKCQ